jgi:hypothetical protein
MNTANFGRIELVWPGKGQWPEQDLAGRWRLVDPPSVSELDVFVERSKVNLIDGDLCPSLLVLGDRLRSLKVLARVVGRSARLVYADVPRLDGFDDTRAFQGIEGRVCSTWLSVLREHFRAVRPLMSRDAAIVVQAGDVEAPYVRQVLAEIFGQPNYVGTALWQTHYSPKGGKESKDIASIHENLICFALDKEEGLGRVALPVPLEGYKNPDGDPRGPWEAKQKDAGRDTSKVTYNVPPYRWICTGGRLPKGLWRVSPMSGVVWGTPQETGTFRIKVRLTDSEGRSAEKSFRLTVKPSASATKPPESVWWMVDPPKAKRGDPIIETTKLPDAVAGQEYSGVLEASGGKPFTGTPRPSRGWAFGQDSLRDAVLEDRCYFGKNGLAIPERKKYPPPGAVKYVNLTSWWADIAFSQDSTKHQNALLEAGIIKSAMPTAKPELLLHRVLDAFAPQGTVALELFLRSADLAAVALKTGRTFIGLAGAAALDRQVATECAIPRLEAVATGREAILLPASETSESKREEFLRLQGQGGFLVMEWDGVLATRLPGEEHSRLNDLAADSSRLMSRILNAEGYLGYSKQGMRGLARSWDGSREAVVLPPNEFLDQATASLFASTRTGEVSLTVYYFRSTEDFAPELIPSVTFRRVPSDLAI